MYDMLWCAPPPPRQAVVVKLFFLENFSNYPSKIFEVCTEIQLDSLSLTTPRLGQHKQIKKEILCFYKFWRLLDRMGAKTKSDSFLTKSCGPINFWKSCFLSIYQNCSLDGLIVYLHPWIITSTCILIFGALSCPAWHHRWLRKTITWPRPSSSGSQCC